MVSNTQKKFERNGKTSGFWKMRLLNDFVITSKSLISSKPSGPRVEGLEADFFTLMENRRFGRKKSNSMSE